MQIEMPAAAKRRSSHAGLALADRCASRLVDTVPLALRFVRAQMRRGLPALTLAQFRAMAFLYRQRDCSLTDLADHLGVTRPTASALVDRLVRDGLASRATNMANRRQLMLRLTRRGMSQFEIAKDAARRQTARRLAGLPATHLHGLLRSLDLLAEVFQHKEMERP